MWSIQKLQTSPVLAKSSCTAFSVKGCKNFSILRELVVVLEDFGTEILPEQSNQIVAVVENFGTGILPEQRNKLFLCRYSCM